MISLHHQSKGFTLIEVMIALVILAVGILGLSTMQIVAIRSNAFSSEMTYASMLAQSRMELLRNMAYDNIVTATDEIIPGNQGMTKGIDYTVKRVVAVNVLDEDGNLIPNLKRVTIEIQWESLRQGEANETVSTSFQTIIHP